MMLILPIALCFAPLFLLFVILFFGFKIKGIHLLLSLLAGLLCVFPVSVLQYFAGMAPFFSNQSLLFIMIKSVVLYGLIEEMCKLLMIAFLPHKKSSSRKKAGLLNRASELSESNFGCSARDFLLLSFFFGLSLGCFESVIYFLDHLQKSSQMGGALLYKPVFIRMFTSDLLHLCTAGILGIFMFEKRKPNGDFHLWLIILAVLLHGVYDFFAGFSNMFKYFSLAVLFFAAIECRVQWTIYNSEKKW